MSKMNLANRKVRIIFSLLILAILSSPGISTALAPHGHFLVLSNLDITSSSECGGFLDNTGMWRNLHLDFNCFINAVDSAARMDWIVGGRDQPPWFYYRIEFLDDAQREDWVLGWAYGGPKSGIDQWEVIERKRFVDPDSVFWYWELNLNPFNERVFLTLPENQRLRITVFFDYAHIEDKPNVMGRSRYEFLRAVGYGGANKDSLWEDVDDYFDRLPWSQRDTVTVEINREAPERGEILFDGIYNLNRVLVNDWLPTPGDTVGLAFRYTNALTEDYIYYSINHISTWQGECMNHPMSAPEPYSIKDSSAFFDYTVAPDPNYNVTARSFEYPSWRIYENAGFPYNFTVDSTASVRGLSVRTLSRVNKDTLWLVSHDYAAHAIVIPSGGATNPSRLVHEASVAGDSVWNVSIPRDRDGYYYYGHNIGDFMADAWEDSFSTDVLTFYPFNDSSTHPPTIWSEIYAADFDYAPDGRDIDGDRLTNFEEYRGFIVTGNDIGFYSNHQHSRTNPTDKTVFVKFMHDLNPNIMSHVPGYFNKVDTTNKLEVLLAYNVANDSGYFIQSDSISMMDVGKYISFNQFGASYPYFSYPKLCSKPFKFKQRCVVFYREYDMTTKPGAMGLCGRLNSVPYGYPEVVRFCMVCYDKMINEIRNNNYYRDRDYEWDLDFPYLAQKTISHEFGHSIEMVDKYNENYSSAYIMGRVNVRRNGRLCTSPPDFIPDFSDSSDSEITIKYRK